MGASLMSVYIHPTQGDVARLLTGGPALTISHGRAGIALYHYTAANPKTS